MGIRLTNGYIDRMNSVVQSNQKKSKQVNGKPDISDKLVCTGNNRYVSANSSDALSSYNIGSLNVNLKKNAIPNGHSRYEYKGAKLDVVRNGDNIKSQMITPKNFDKNDFIQRFSNLDQTINSHNTQKTGSSISSVNGKLDEYVIQYKTGDCWLVSGLYGLDATPTGRQIIKDAITVNDNSTVTVNFDGIGASYTITEEELSKYDTDYNTYDSYSNGDNDMLVMELATEKLWKDINSGKVSLNSNNPDITYTGIGNGIDDGGLPSQIIYYLTGIESDEYYNYDMSDLSSYTINNVLDNAMNSGNTALSFAVYDNNHSAKLTDGTTYSLDLGNSGHALAITNITPDTVTFVNPWDTSTSYEMSRSEFAKLGIGYISAADLSSVADKHPISNNEIADTNSDENEVNNTVDNNEVINTDTDEQEVNNTDNNEVINTISDDEIINVISDDENEVISDDYFDYNNYNNGIHKRHRPHFHDIINDFNQIFYNDFIKIFDSLFGMLNQNFSLGFNNQFNNVFGFSSNFGFSNQFNNFYTADIGNSANSTFQSVDFSFNEKENRFNIRMMEIKSYNPW